MILRRKRKTAKRREWAKAKLELSGPRYEMEGPADGIERKKDRFSGHIRWKVVNPNAWDGIRAALYERAHGKCEGCFIDVSEDDFHMHHFRGRGMGGARRCDCPDCNQVLCGDQPGTGHVGCHTLAHKQRLGERFVKL